MVAPEDERHDAPAHDRLQLLGDLRRRAFGIAGRHGEIPCIDDRKRPEHVDSLDRMPGAEQHRGIADGGRPETSPGTHRRRRVERDADHGDVHTVELVLNERAAGKRANPRVPGRLARIRRPVPRHRRRILPRFRRHSVHDGCRPEGRLCRPGGQARPSARSGKGRGPAGGNRRFPPANNDHGLHTREPAIGRQIQGAPLALRRSLQRTSSELSTDVCKCNRHSAARYLSFSHSVTWTRYSSHSRRLSSM